ncbi:DUF1513 domain-containing protein [Hoeflea olei]|uniref:DUF1513 domain-containing protein n=1 Tax=Hoeflea olei TaxID=1480615 RepID=A0A1C1YRQ4_9HYPH|nr:DUF1513 domain-containing protein [Hoeflea olei]OCW56222.1 hypothetical protein AWJ14_19190 [Hoeflea olei]
MSRIVLERRTFLAGAGLAWLSALTPAGAERLAASELLFAAAYMDAKGAYGVAILDRDGARVSAHDLPGRGHGFATHATADWLVAFARRPGNFAVALHTRAEARPLLFHTPADRHFYGHGAFSPDGRLLYAAENAYETGDGMIGVYDATDGFARIGEFPTHGIGPHELVLMPDGRTLCVANGGIRTHPDQGRAKLNLATMAPSIVFIDRTSGELKSSHALASRLNRLSLRHMAVDASSRVWIGGQYEGDAMDEVPVLARLDEEAGLVAVDLPADVAQRFGLYAGSVAIGNDGVTLGVASPKSGVVLTLDTRSGQPLALETAPRTCGLQASGSGFISSSERGRFGTTSHACAWDNHIARV